MSVKQTVRPGRGLSLLVAAAFVVVSAQSTNNWRSYCKGGMAGLNCRVHTPANDYSNRFSNEPMPSMTGQATHTTNSIVSADGAVVRQDQGFDGEGLVAASYAVSTGALYLDDAATGIPDIATIHNGRYFKVYQLLEWDQEVFVLNSTNLLLWEMFVDGVSTEKGSVNLRESRSLPKEIEAGTGIVSNSGTHAISVQIRLDNIKSQSERNYQSFNKGASFWPLIVVLVFAMSTHMVELSLGLGVFVGACMVSGTVTDGFKSTLDTYILEALASVDHGYVYLFALFMSGMVGVIEKSGGLIGITVALKKYVKSARSAQLAGFFCGLIIFFDDYANTLVAGNSMKPLMDAFCISREKLAFIVDATAAPIASIVPISSWVGFEVSLIQTELDKILAMDDNPEIVTTGFGVFLETIKYRYYCIFMLFLMPLLIFAQRDMGPMLIAERRTRIYGRTDGGPGAALTLGGEALTSANAPDPDTPCRWWNMALPIVMLVFYIFYLLIITGIDPDAQNQTFLDIMQLADSYSALLWGTMAGALTSWAFYLLQDKKDGRIIWFNVKGRYNAMVRWFKSSKLTKCCRKKQEDGGDDDDDMEAEKEHAKPLMTYREAMTSFLQGTEHIFGALVVLTLAWASGHIMVAVGLDRFFGELITESDLDYRMLPTISFVISMLIAFATGTSWGTMTIMFPLMLVPSYNASGGDPNIFYGTTAGILAGAVAGDHASPISDTTILSSMASECKVMEHVRTQAPYVLVVTTWSILVGTIPSGMESYPNGVGILLGFVFMLLHTIFTSAPPISKHGRFDIFTELYLKCTKNPDLLQLKADSVRAFEEGGPIPMPMADEDSNDSTMDEDGSPRKPAKAAEGDDGPTTEANSSNNASSGKSIGAGSFEAGKEEADSFKDESAEKGEAEGEFVDVEEAAGEGEEGTELGPNGSASKYGFQ